MKVNVESAGGCRRILHVSVPRETVEAEFRKVAAGYARVARVPGFRPGRAPAPVVEQRYAKEIAQDVRDTLVPRGYQDALKQQNLRTVAVLDVRDDGIVRGSDFLFDVVVDVEPDFALPEYRNVSITGRTAEVTDADVDRIVEGLREQSSRFEDVAGRPSKPGDLVRIDYSGLCDGRPVGELGPDCAGMGEGKDFWALLDEGHEVLPGLSARLVGAAAGETRSVEIAFPADYPVKTIAGRTAVYQVALKAIRERKLAEMDAAFFQRAGVAGMDELRSRIRDDMVRFRENEETTRRRGEIVEWLARETKIETLPQSAVQDEVQNTVRDIVHENLRRGISKDLIQEKKDDILTAATRSSEDRVKLQQILGRIADVEKIEVEEPELRRRVAALAARQRTPPAKLWDELQERGAIEVLRRELRADKALDFILEHANVTMEQPRPAGPA